MQTLPSTFTIPSESILDTLISQTEQLLMDLVAATGSIDGTEKFLNSASLVRSGAFGSFACSLLRSVQGAMMKGVPFDKCLGALMDSAFMMGWQSNALYQDFLSNRNLPEDETIEKETVQ